MTQVARAAVLSVPIAITARTAESAVRLASSVGNASNRRCRRGATTTEAKAWQSPQPKKIRPISGGPMMTASPRRRVRFAPIRLETTPVMSIATPMTAM